MAKEKKIKGAPTNNTGRPTGSYNNYATSGYGNSYGGASYGRNPYGTPQPNPVNGAKANNSPVPAEKKSADGGKKSGKQSKIEKKASKFDETDLRCYPMTVGAWIGTFILLAIPLINVICGICWFFGVGNKSRTAWVRSYVVIVLIIVIILGILFGVGYGVLSKNAKAEGYEGFTGTIYYSACKVIDMLEEPLGGPEAAAEYKSMIAEMLGLTSGEEGGGQGDGSIGSGSQDDSNIESNGGEYGDGEYEEMYA